MASSHKSARGWECTGWCSSSGLTSNVCRLTVHPCPIKQTAHSTTPASNQTTSVSKDNAAHGRCARTDISPCACSLIDFPRTHSFLFRNSFFLWLFATSVRRSNVCDCGYVAREQAKGGVGGSIHEPRDPSLCRCVQLCADGEAHRRPRL